MSEYKPGTYVKGDLPPREAVTAADAVALVFDGYKLQEEVAEEAEATPDQATEEPETVPSGQPAQRELPTKKKD